MIECPKNQFNSSGDELVVASTPAVSLGDTQSINGALLDLRLLTSSELGLVLWDYHRLSHTITKADCILALGGPDLRVAEHAAGLYNSGMAPLVVCTGGIAHSDDLLATGWDIPEAEVFAQTIQKLGVPRSAILVEPRASNTSENIRFSWALLSERQAEISSIIIAVKPHMERRAFATCQAAWPGVNPIMASQQVSFAEYPTERISENTVINLMVGDLQRIWIYGEKGFQIKQEVPRQVLRAFDELVKRGYSRHLVHGSAMSPGLQA